MAILMIWRNLRVTIFTDLVNQIYLFMIFITGASRVVGIQPTIHTQQVIPHQLLRYPSLEW